MPRGGKQRFLSLAHPTHTQGHGPPVPDPALSPSWPLPAPLFSHGSLRLTIKGHKYRPNPKVKISQWGSMLRLREGHGVVNPVAVTGG
ncbi:hypothetical protein DSO57_1022191, partial [Entomophthora muscae]